MKALKENLSVILLSVFEIAVGVLLLVDPVVFTSMIFAVLGAALCVFGVIYTIRYFRTEPLQASIGQFLVKGVSALVVGVFCLVKYSWLASAFPFLTVVYGVVILFMGITKLQRCVDMLRMGLYGWFLPAVGALLSVISAMVIFFNPFDTANFLWGFTGILLIIEAVVDIVSLIFGGKERDEII